MSKVFTGVEFGNELLDPSGTKIKTPPPSATQYLQTPRRSSRRKRGEGAEILRGWLIGTDCYPA